MRTRLNYYGLGLLLTSIPAAGYTYVIEGSIIGGLVFAGLAALGIYLYDFKENPTSTKEKNDEVEQ